MAGGRRGTLTLRREDGRIVCDSVTVADTTWRRMRGLLGRGRLRPGEGSAPPPGLVDSHRLHAIPDRRGVHRPRPDRDPDRALDAVVQDGLVPGSARGRRARCGRVREARAGGRRPRRLGIPQPRGTASAARTRCSGSSREGSVVIASGDQRFSSWRTSCSTAAASASQRDVRPEELARGGRGRRGRRSAARCRGGPR